MKIKTLLSSVAICLALALGSMSCNNKAPFERLHAAVDSVRMEAQQVEMPGVKSIDINLNEVTNCIDYTVEIDADLNQPNVKETFEALAPMMAEQLTYGIVSSNQYDIAHEMVENHTGMLFTFKGTQGGNFELPISAEDFEKAYQNAGKVD